MARVKGGKTANKRRKNILAMTKGYRFGRSTKKAQAKEAIFHAGKYAFAHRRDKKNDFRRLWNVRINGGLDERKSRRSAVYSKHRHASQSCRPSCNPFVIRINTAMSCLGSTRYGEFNV
jgi:ribosomal protein L20